MRIILALITIAAAAWSGYWYVASAAVTRGFGAGLDTLRAEGWTARAASIETGGFPYRFDTSFSDITLADPETGLAWEAPVFRIFALSYEPGHVIAVWPARQVFATPQGKYDLESSDMRASLVTGATPRLPLERMVLTAASLAITPREASARAGSARAGSAPTRLEELRLAAARVATTASAYRLGLAAEGLSPGPEWRTRLDPAGRLPERFDAVTADLTVSFDKPWDRLAITQPLPQPRRITLRRAEARWGRLALQESGEVTVDARGRPQGEIAIKARNWREILQMAAASGQLDAHFAARLEDGLSRLTQMADDPQTLDIALTFAKGRVWLGPVPLGPAPVLRLR